MTPINAPKILGNSQNVGNKTGLLPELIKMPNILKPATAKRSRGEWETIKKLASRWTINIMPDKIEN